MKYRDSDMSFMNRPDERRREAARLARASQVKPLGEPETFQVVQGDSTFSMVTVPNSQHDDFSRSVMTVLGPYRNILRGPQKNGIHAAKVSNTPFTEGGGEGPVPGSGSGGVGGYSKDMAGIHSRADTMSQDMLASRNKEPSMSSFASTSAGTSSSKNPSSLSPCPGISTVSSQSSSKPLRPPLLPIPASSTSLLHLVASSSTPSSHQVASLPTPSLSHQVLSSSPPSISHLDAAKSPSSQVSIRQAAQESHSLQQDHGEMRDGKIWSKRQTTPPPSSSSKHDTSPRTLKPQKVDLHSQKHQGLKRNSSKSSLQPSASSSAPLKDESKDLNTTASSHSRATSSSGTSAQDIHNSRGTSSTKAGHNSKGHSAVIKISKSLVNKPNEELSSLMIQSLQPSQLTQSSDMAQSFKEAQSLRAPKPSSTLPVVSDPSPSKNKKQNQSLSQVSAPSKTKTDFPNGVNLHHSTKFVSSSIETGTTSSAEKSRLKLKMPNDNSGQTSKRDLQHIIQELAEIHAPLTAIQSPPAADNGFQFSTSDATTFLNSNLMKSAHQMSEVTKDAAVPRKKTSFPKDKSLLFQEGKSLSFQKGKSPSHSLKLSLKVYSSNNRNDDRLIVKEEIEEKRENESTVHALSATGQELSRCDSEDSDGADGLLSKETEHKSLENGIYDVNHSYGGGGGFRAAVTAPTIGAALDDLMCGKVDGNPSSASSNVSPNSVFFSSILREDLLISEDDSDIESTAEENTTSCQSKKGKVMAMSPGATVREAVSPLSSSSSNSSSESSSESSEDEEEDDEEEVDEKEDKEEARDKKIEEKKSERRMSTSSSSSGSSSSSEASSDEEDGAEDENDKTELHKTTPEGLDMKAIDKTDKPLLPEPFPVAVSKTQQEASSDTGMIWCLKNFIQRPKKSSSSPSSVSPAKTLSSPTSHSAPPSVLQKERSITTPEQSSRSQDTSPCDNLSFCSQKYPKQNDNVFDARTNSVSNNSEFSDNNKRTKLSSKNDQKPSECGIESKTTAHNQSDSGSSGDRSRKDNSKNVSTKKMALSSSKELSRSLSDPSSSSKNDRNKSASSSMKKNKGSQSVLSSGSVSEAVSVTVHNTHNESDQDDEAHNAENDRLAPSLEKSVGVKNKHEASKTGLEENLVERSGKDLKSMTCIGKNAPIRDIKYHKRKHEPSEQKSFMKSPRFSLSPDLSTSSFSLTSTSSIKQHRENAEATTDLHEIVSKPHHLNKSIPTTTSRKPSPALPSQSLISTMPSSITLSKNSDGSTQPKLIIKIHNKFLRRKVLSWLKEKRETRKKFDGDAKLLDSKNLEEEDSFISKRITTHSEAHNTKTSHKKKDNSKETPLTKPKVQEPMSSTSSSAPSIQSDKSKLPSVHTNKAKSADNSLEWVLPKQAKSSKKNLALQIVSPALQILSSSSSSKISTNHDLSVETATSVSASLPQSTAHKSTISTPTTPSKTSNAAKNLDFMNESRLESYNSKTEKIRAAKRKPEDVDEVLSKKTKFDEVSEQNGSTSGLLNSVPSKVHPSSTPSKKSDQMVNKNKDLDSENSKANDSTNDEVCNGPDSNSLPFNHYIKKSSDTSSNLDSSAPSTSSSAIPANLPVPSPIETQLHNTKHYLARAREHKHHADGLRDKLEKYEPYLRSGLSFFLAGYSMEASKREMSCSMYNDTSLLLQYVIRLRASSSSNCESNDRERKLIILLIRLQSYLYHRMYRLRRAEVSKLKKIIDSEQAKLHLSPATTSAGPSTGASSTKPHAPSPHQSSWNKNSTGTPSPMSPTPSPAGSVSSQGSCELVQGKIPNGTLSSSSTPMTSPSPGLSSVQQQFQSLTHRYFTLTYPMVKADELWEQAEAESKAFGDFFTVIDNTCGPLSFHSEPFVIVRYMKHALRVLSIWH